MSRRADPAETGETAESPASRLRRAAMDYLARREHSFAELLQKLADKFPDLERESDILPVLEDLRNENLQSDERFAENFVRTRRNRGAGPLKIAAELRHKGLASELIHHWLYQEDNDWPELARQALEKKFGSDEPGDGREWQRRYRFLAQRGFDSEAIRAAMNQRFMA